MALCGNGTFLLSSSNPDQQTASLLRRERNDLIPQPDLPSFCHIQLELKETWKRKGEKEGMGDAGSCKE